MALALALVLALALALALGFPRLCLKATAGDRPVGFCVCVCVRVCCSCRRCGLVLVTSDQALSSTACHAAMLPCFPCDSYTATWTRPFPPPFATACYHLTQQPSAYRVQRRSSSRPISHSMTPCAAVAVASRSRAPWSPADESASQTLTSASTWIKPKSWESLPF